MRKSILCPALALVLGGLGAALRMRQLAGYENGLPPAGSVFSLLLLLLCAGAAVLFLLLALTAGAPPADCAFPGSHPIRAGLLLAGAGLLLLSAVLYLKDIMDGMALGTPVGSLLLELILVILSVPAVISMAFLAKDAKEGNGRSRNSLTVVAPVLYCWVWLIEVYRQHTANPVLWDYVFLLLAVIALLLAAQCRAGFAFGDGKGRLAVFCSLAALFLVPISLTGWYGAAHLTATIGMTLYVLASVSAVLDASPSPKRLIQKSKRR